MSLRRCIIFNHGQACWCHTAGFLSIDWLYILGKNQLRVFTSLEIQNSHLLQLISVLWDTKVKSYVLSKPTLCMAGKLVWIAKNESHCSRLWCVRPPAIYLHGTHVVEISEKIKIPPLVQTLMKVSISYLRTKRVICFIS